MDRFWSYTWRGLFQLLGLVPLIVDLGSSISQYSDLQAIYDLLGWILPSAGFVSFFCLVPWDLMEVDTALEAMSSILWPKTVALLPVLISVIPWGDILDRMISNWSLKLMMLSELRTLLLLLRLATTVSSNCGSMAFIGWLVGMKWCDRLVLTLSHQSPIFISVKFFSGDYLIVKTWILLRLCVILFIWHFNTLSTEIAKYQRLLDRSRD